jgi:hypothetical protein
MKRYWLKVCLFTLLLSCGHAQAFVNTFNDIVVGSAGGYYAIRGNDSTLSEKVYSAQSNLNCGTVLPNGNIVLGTYSMNGLVTIRRGDNLVDMADDYFGSDIRAMAACPDGNVVFGTAGGNIYKRSGVSLSDIAYSSGYGLNAITDMAVAPNGNVIIASNYGYVWLRNSILGAINYITGHGNISAVAVQPDGNIMIGNTSGTLWRLNSSLGILQTRTNLGYIIDITVLSNGNVVVGNYGGNVWLLNGTDISSTFATATIYGAVQKLAHFKERTGVTEHILVANNLGELRKLDGNTLGQLAYIYNLGNVKVLDVQAAIVMQTAFPVGWYDDVAYWEPNNIIDMGGNKALIYTAGFTNPNDPFQHLHMTCYLDEAAKRGASVIVCVKELVAAQNWSALNTFVNAYKNHPALEGWYTADEPTDCGPSVSLCQTAYTNIKAQSNKPIYMGFCKSDLGELDKYGGGDDPYTHAVYLYRNTYDILLFDRYPCEDDNSEFEGFPDQWILGIFLNHEGWVSVINRAKTHATAANKPWQTIIQAFGYGWGKRLPTYAEERFMVFYARYKQLGGFPESRGIWFWADDQLDLDPNAAWWRQNVGRPIMEELNLLAPAISTAEITGGVSINNGNTAVIHRDTTTTPNTYYVLAFRRNSGSNSSTITLYPNVLEPGVTFTAAVPLFENGQPISITNNQFSDSFSSYGVHNYRLIRQ